MLEIRKKKLQILSCALKHTRLYPAVRIHHVKDKHTGYYIMTINNREQKCSAIICQLYLCESVSSLLLKSLLQRNTRQLCGQTRLAYCYKTNEFPVNMDEYFPTR